MKHQRCLSRRALAAISAAASALIAAPAYAQQRVLGVDISYHNTGSNQDPGSPGISQANWDTGFSTGNRKFAFIRATRGGTTGVDQPQGTPGGGSLSTLSRRYDDPRFIQNINRAVNAGLFAGPYHFGRPDIAGNTGTDEADHFIQMASPWMRPGYLMPVYDFEAGSGADTLAQFAIDFSNRIYAVMQLRPGVYVGGNYSDIVQGATASRRNQLAQPVTPSPTVTGPAYPMLWNPRYAYPNDDNNSALLTTANPKDTASTFYGPWDDYGTTHPWDFWQSSSSSSVPGFNSVDTNIDSDVAHGDIEYVRNFLVPALWWNDSSGDWGTMSNWNSGQTPTAPLTPSNQATPFETGPLPTPRLPGTAGAGPTPTQGQYDTVILERPNSNITVTLSGGTYNIRKLYMRETLNITGGSLTINYDPTYRADNSSTVLHGGPLTAQFSGAVTLSGAGSLTAHTFQVDSARTFTLAGGTLSFNTINLMPHSTTPATLAITGDLTINPLNNATATVANGSGAGSSGRIDLGGGVRSIIVGNGSADIDLAFNVPVSNGGITKNGAGTLSLAAANTFSGNVQINVGRIVAANSSALGSSSNTLIFNGGQLRTDVAINTASRNVTVNPSGGTLDSNSFNSTFGNVTGGGSLTKNAAGDVTVNLVQIANLTVNAGTVKIADNGTSKLANLIANGGRLDLNHGKLIVSTPLSVGSWNGGTYTGMSGRVAAGRNAGDWNGSTGIMTSDPQADALLTGLAIATAAQAGKSTFGGLSVAPTDTLIMYTYAGDANLSGFVDADDYFQIDSHYNKVDNASKSFFNGDFNLDGVFDGDDYTIIDASFSGQGSPFSPGAPAAVTSVPEPATLSMLLLTVLLQKRRRQKHL